MKEKLQLINDFTLEKALETARQHELTKSQMKAQQAEVDLVSKKQFNSFRPSSSKSSNQKANCGRCGRQHCPGQCPAHGKECLRCGEKNHFAKFCHTKPRTRSESHLRKIKVALDTVQIQVAQINQEEDKSMKLLMQEIPVLLT